MAVMIRPAELDHATSWCRSSTVPMGDASCDLDPWPSRTRAPPGTSACSVDTPVSWNTGSIAEDAETPVGVLIIHQLDETAGQLEATILSPLWVPFVDLDLEASGPGYIMTLSVIEAQRGEGVGGQLLRFAERFRGPEGMSAILGNHDEASRRFFEQNGYAEAAGRKV
jgi:GNAT superfamily N-acetyltransferase